MKPFTLRISSDGVIWSAVVFLIIFLSAKLGQFLFFEMNTSPAILWPPTGIALAVIWLGGYRFAVPIFLALSAASLSGPLSHLVVATITTPLAQVLGAVLGVYFLKRLKFDDTLTTVRNVLLFFIVIVFTSMVAPTISTLISYAMGNLTTSAYISWSRSGAGYLLSCLILFPFIVSWVSHTTSVYETRNKFEIITVSLLTFFSVYFLFWIPEFVSQFSFFLFSIFFIAYFWICLRFSTRVLTLSFLFLAVFGFLGLFLSPAPDEALTTRLFSTELFLFLMLPIFYLFSALAKERATTIAELHALTKKYERDDVVKSNFISVLAHELRNPLAPVKTTLEILKLDESSPETLELIANAEKQIHSMRRLLDDLLDITRVTQGKFQLKIEEAHLCTMISHSLDSVNSQFKDRNHTIQMDPKCDDLVWLKVDPVRFEQVMVNVLNNAAKYTKAGGIIRVVTEVHDEWVDLKIIDNGVGIKKEHLTDIFKPFWQSNKVTQDALAGIGVGLSLTKHIVEMHNGKIRAESEGIDKGSTIVITMPIHKMEPKNENTTIMPESTLTLAPRRILVVDDNTAAADSLAKLLSLKGHHTEKAYTAAELFQKVKTHNPEVILLDIGLPDMNGYDAATKLRAEKYGGILIALSGYGQKEDKEKAMVSGFNHHITKPMKLELLEQYLLSLG